MRRRSALGRVPEEDGAGGPGLLSDSRAGRIAVWSLDKRYPRAYARRMAERRILHYRILGPPKAGGQGEILLAQDERLGRRVALKFLRGGAVADPTRVERLHREARSLASLNHPGIAAIYALEASEDRSFLVMEYVEGENLAERIARRPLPLDEVIRIGREVSAALAHAHARRVIHRDVKPANILITRDGTAKLVDFGLALLAEETRLTLEGEISGTLHYMSPEQASGGGMDARTDIFSLGAVLYEALTGRRSFEAPTPEALLLAIKLHEPEPPTALRTGIPLELERIVLKCLRKEPTLRYQDAADLGADLKALEIGAGTTRTVTGGIAGSDAATNRPKPGRRLRTTVAVAGGLVAILVVGGLFIGKLWRSRPVPSTPPGGIAVLAFRNLADPEDAGHEALIAASLLTVGLGEAQEVPVLGAQKIGDVMRAMHLSEKSVSQAEALEVGRRAGATYVVTGYVAATSPAVVLAAEVASTRDGSLIAASKVEAPGGDRGVFAAVDSLTAALRGGLARAGMAVTNRRVEVAALTTQEPAAYRAYVRGMEELNQYRFEEAGRAFRAAIVLDSLFALPRYYAAIADWWQGDIGAGRIEAAQGLALGKRLSGRERDGFRALEALLRRDLGRAETIYRELLARYPDDKEFLYGLGEALAHSSRYDEAARVLEHVVAIDPTFGVAYIHLVDMDVLNKDLPGALAHTAAYARADPANPAALRLEAEVRGNLGDGEGAIRTLGRLLQRDPKDHFALYSLAVAHAWRGQFREAEEYLSRLRGAVPQEDAYGPAFAELSLLYARGRMRDLLRVADARVASAESSAVIFRLDVGYWRFRAFEALHRYDEAEATAREAAEQLETLLAIRDPVVPNIVELKVRAGHLGDAERLLAEYRRKLGSKVSPEEKSGLDYTAGVIALAKGRGPEAVRLLRGGFPPTAPRPWGHSWNLAQALLMVGNRKEAMRELQDIGVSGAFYRYVVPIPSAWLLLARTLEQEGDRAGALELYQRVEQQYREADPDLSELLEARAGTQRLTRTTGVSS
jgi:tetratricopeptide (TPR) repeat protein